MSKSILGSHKFSGGILSIYCLSLAIVPTAHARSVEDPVTPVTPVTNTSGYTNNNFNAFSQPNTSVAGSGSGAGSKENEPNATSTLATIKAAQGFTALLDDKQTAFNASSAAYEEQLAQSSATPPAPCGSKPDVARFTVRNVGLAGGEVANYGCPSSAVAATPTKPDNSAALAAARAAKEKAATELAQAQTQARQFLQSLQQDKVSAQNTRFSPLW
jgi:hypothetical protein